MSSTTKSEIWTENAQELLSHPILNFCTKRRIPISLIGFTSLACYNLLIRQTVPLNPFDFTDWQVCLAFVLLLLGLAIRSWSAGSLNKSREVTQCGPYALMRNPLYLGSFAMMVAFCLLMRDMLTLGFIVGPMAFLYWLQIVFEEKRLAFLFPNEWPSYTQRVPRVFPKLWAKEAFVGWTKFEWLRNREYQAVAASIAGCGLIYTWHVLAPLLWK